MPIRKITNYIQSQDQTSPLNSRKTLKLLSFLKLGCAARRVRNTSCIATVFLNVARYSLKDTQNSASPGIWVGWGGGEVGWGGGGGGGRRGEEITLTAVSEGMVTSCEWGWKQNVTNTVNKLWLGDKCVQSVMYHVT